MSSLSIGRLPKRGAQARRAVARERNASRTQLPVRVLNTESTDDSTEEHSEEHSEEHQSYTFNPLVFFLTTFVLSAICQSLEDCFHSLPHSVNLFLGGSILSAIADINGNDWELFEAIREFQYFDAHTLFWVLLPILLYEDASSVDWHIMSRCMPSCLLMAVPGVLINSLMTAVPIYFFFKQVDWSFNAAVLLSSILSATDPVAVVSALHELHAPAHLSNFIAGESLVNDGTAYVMFKIFQEVSRHGADPFSLETAITDFFHLALGGVAWGMLLCIVGYLWFSWIPGDYQTEILVVMIIIWGGYFSAEHETIEVSGVLAVVIFGFFMAYYGRYLLDRSKQHERHSIIEFAAMLSGEAIFVIAGVVGWRLFTVVNTNTTAIDGWDYLELCILYFIIHGTRTIVVVLFTPMLRQIGYGLRMKEAVIVIFGGLRGAVGLALALIVESDMRIDENIAVRICFHVSGIVVLTLLVNGVLVTPLYTYLDIYPVSNSNLALEQTGLAQAEIDALKYPHRIRGSWFFCNTKIDRIKEVIPNFEEFVNGHGHGHAHASVTSDDHSDPEDYLSLAHKLMHLRKSDFTREMQKFGVLGVKGSSHNTLKGRVWSEVMGIAEELGKTSLAKRYLMKLKRGDRSDTLLNSHKNVLSVDNIVKMHNSDENRAHLGYDLVQTLRADEGRVRTHVEESQLTGSEKYKYLWKKAIRSVRFMIKMIRADECSQRQEQREITFLRSSTVNMKCLSIDTLDTETAAEVYQQVLNAASFAYSKLHEDGILTSSESKLLQDSLAFGREACEGKLVPYHFLCAGKVGFSSDGVSLADLPSSNHLVQIKSSFHVVSAYVVFTLELAMPRTAAMATWIEQKVCNVLEMITIRISRAQNKWHRVKRSTMVILAYVMVHEQLLQEMNVFTQFPRLKSTVMSTVEYMKHQAFPLLLKAHAGMMAINEHIIVAIILAASRKRLLKECARIGMLPPEDAEHLAEHFLDPVMHALRQVVPSKKMLQMVNNSSGSEENIAALQELNEIYEKSTVEIRLPRACRPQHPQLLTSIHEAEVGVRPEVVGNVQEDNKANKDAA